jgi:hypothetical protein
VRTFVVSTTGLAPVTVIVSAILPTRNSPFTLAVADGRANLLDERRTGDLPTEPPVSNPLA